MRACRIAVESQPRLCVDRARVLRGDEIESSYVGTRSGHRGTEISRPKSIGVGVHQDRGGSLPPDGGLANLNHSAVGRDGNIAKAATVCAGNILKGGKGANVSRAQPRNLRATRHHGAALVPNNPDRDRRTWVGSFSRNDRGLINAARERSEI